MPVLYQDDYLVAIEKPGGTFYSFPDFSHYDKDSVALSKFILDKVQVLTVPGKEFGMEGHLRLSFCGSIKEITEGIERMKWALDPNSPVAPLATQAITAAMGSFDNNGVPQLFAKLRSGF